MSTANASTPLKTKRIGLIIGSTRTPRVGPSIASLLQKSVTKHLASTASTASPSQPSIDLIDLAEINLPLFDEPTIPMHAKSPESYAQPHTQRWSRLVSSFDGFIFLTPQYNWSVPAALKNAIDYLFNEWTAKPAMVISYGARGGDKAARHLVEILLGVRMEIDWWVDRELGVVEDVTKPRRYVDGEMGDGNKGTGVVTLSFGKIAGALNGAATEGALDVRMKDAWTEELGRVNEGVDYLIKKIGV